MCKNKQNSTQSVRSIEFMYERKNHNKTFFVCDTVCIDNNKKMIRYDWLQMTRLIILSITRSLKKRKGKEETNDKLDLFGIKK